MKIVSMALAMSLASMAAGEPRKVGDWFVVGYETNGGRVEGDGLLPGGEYALVVPTADHLDEADLEWEPGEGIEVRLVEVSTGKVLWKQEVGGDFSWGPLTSMVTARWNPSRPWQRWEPEGFILRTNMGRMMSETRLFLRTEAGEWKEARAEASDFEESEYFKTAYAEAKRIGEEWYEKHQPPNHPPAGYRHFGDWVDGRKIIVHEAAIGDLIYRYDFDGRLFLVGFDPQPP